MGTSGATHTRWDQDVLADCSPEDQIWGWSIRSTEVLHHDRAKFDDRVLVKMLYNGLLDRKDGAPAWSETLSIKQAVRHMSSALVRVVQRCFKTEDKVSNPGRFLLRS